MVVLYHYTDDKGAKGIRASEVIYGSSTGGPDAVFGAGVYLTDLSPELNSEEIARFIYDGDGFWERKMGNLEYVLKISLPKSTVKLVSQRRHIWLYPHSQLDLNEVDDWEIINVSKEKETNDSYCVLL